MAFGEMLMYFVFILLFYWKLYESIKFNCNFSRKKLLSQCQPGMFLLHFILPQFNPTMQRSVHFGHAIKTWKVMDF